MSTLDFITGIESYYGQAYTAKAGPYIKTWLDGKSSAWRASLFTVVLSRYSGFTAKGERYLPNIAIFHSYDADVRKLVKGGA